MKDSIILQRYIILTRLVASATTQIKAQMLKAQMLATESIYEVWIIHIAKTQN